MTTKNIIRQVIADEIDLLRGIRGSIFLFKGENDPASIAQKVNG